MTTEDLESRRRRAQWRALHRGTKELDLMIGRFAAARLGDMDEKFLARFEAFLAVSEPQLQMWLLAPSLEAGCDFADLVGEVRRFNGLG